MTIADILLTHMEVSMGLAGFAALVATLRRPLSRYARVRVIGLLFAALASMVGSVVPVMLFRNELPMAGQWVTSCRVMLLAMGVYWVVWVPIAVATGARAFLMINPLFTVVVWTLTTVVMLIFLFGSLEWFFTPAFWHYYSALLCMLIGIFIVFTDVVISDDA